ncbi:MAG: hypothetical protein ACRD4K_07325 [Candidatus Acidiferrales bacterium]
MAHSVTSLLPRATYHDAQFAIDVDSFPESGNFPIALNHHND